jgi:hypothetical protein
MNKRIEDLIYQAGLTAQGCWDEMDPYDRDAILNLVESVIRECAQVAGTAEPFQTSDLILKHFGVDK